jgi:hypothetical protein
VSGEARGNAGRELDARQAPPQRRAAGGRQPIGLPVGVCVACVFLVVSLQKLVTLLNLDIIPETGCPGKGIFRFFIFLKFPVAGGATVWYILNHVDRQKGV